MSSNFLRRKLCRGMLSPCSHQFLSTSYFKLKWRGLIHLYLCIQFLKRGSSQNLGVLFHQKNTGLVEKFLVNSLGKSIYFSQVAHSFSMGTWVNIFSDLKKYHVEEWGDTFWCKFKCLQKFWNSFLSFLGGVNFRTLKF